MSFANFGIGLGAFTQGLSSGMQTGQQMRQMKDRRDIQSQAKKGLSTAREQRASDIDSRIDRTGMDDRVDFMGDVTTGYEVNGQRFSDEDAARGEAEKGADSVMDYFMRDAAPRIAETYMSQGNIEKAEGWRNFISDRNHQDGIRNWSRALRAAQMGDMDGFASGLEAAYNTPGYMDDGVTAKGHKINEDGSIAMTFERDGKEFTQTFEGTDDLVQAGIGLLSPQAAFEATMQQTQAAAEARNEAAMDEQDFQRDLTRDEFKQNLKDRSDARSEGREEQRAIETLRRWNYSDEEIREMVPRIIGANNTRAEISDTDLRKSIMETLAVSDRRWRSADPEEKEALINEMMSIVRGEKEEESGGSNQRPEQQGLGSDYLMYP